MAEDVYRLFSRPQQLISRTIISPSQAINDQDDN